MKFLCNLLEFHFCTISLKFNWFTARIWIRMSRQWIAVPLHKLQLKCQRTKLHCYVFQDNVKLVIVLI